MSKVYSDGTVAVRELTLEVPTGELLCLVGPSGCGKSTTMRMVNRLVEPTSGRIYVNGRDVTDADPVELRRGIGYVIQQVGLFPHRTVADNVATVPRLTGASKKAARTRAEELLELVGLDPAVFAKRYPAQLSGGQRQRVGVARALAADPPVLLMDEPFSAIDPIARDRLQEEFLRVQREVRKTILFVTHDIDEAVRLGDRIAVFKEGGVLEQVATPADLLAHPATPFVAGFVGADRGLRRLRVVPLAAAHLVRPQVLPSVGSFVGAFALVGAPDAPTGWTSDGATVLPLPAAVQLGASLDQAFGQVLTEDAGWAPVLSDGRYVGVLTPEVVHATLRAS